MLQKKLDCIDIDLTYLFANMNMWQKEGDHNCRVLGPFISETSGCAVNVLELEKSKRTLRSLNCISFCDALIRNVRLSSLLFSLITSHIGEVHLCNYARNWLCSFFMTNTQFVSMKVCAWVSDVLLWKTHLHNMTWWFAK